MMKFKHLLLWFVIGICLCGTVHASTGLPMLVVVWPAFWLLLIPMIALKFWYFKKKFNNEHSIHLLRGVTITNVFGALLGVPLTWVIFAGIEVLFQEGQIGSEWATGLWKRLFSVTIEAPWLMHYPTEYYWMVPVAFMVLLVPFFIISTISESWILHRYFLQHHSAHEVKKVTNYGNIVTYILLYMLGLGWLMFNMMHRYS